MTCSAVSLRIAGLLGSAGAKSDRSPTRQWLSCIPEIFTVLPSQRNGVPTGVQHVLDKAFEVLGHITLQHLTFQSVVQLYTTATLEFLSVSFVGPQ